MIAVLKHELRTYFRSLTAYVFGAFLLLFIGIGSVLYNLQAAVSNFEFVLGFSCLVFVVIVPILTMRVIAEERKQKTDQLLYSLPITTTQVVLGKYLALLVVYLIPLAIISLYPLIFSQYGDVYLLTAYGSILAFFILGAALIALGVFISSLTENQGFAAGIGIAVILLNYYSVSLSQSVSSTAFGSLVALAALIVALGFIIKHLTKNNPMVWTICIALYAAIGIDDIYLGEINIYSGTYNASDFDGEGAITSAIDYVTSEEYPQVYILEGHGEAELPASFAEQIEKENMETNTLSLLTVDEIPEEADCIVIYAPESDLSVEEKDMLADYVADGGKLLVMAGAVKEGILENLYSLLGDYGVTANEGIVVDNDRKHYAFGVPYVLMPDMASSHITDPLIEENYYAIMPISLGLTVDGSTSKGTVTQLLTTSYNSFSKSFSKLAGDSFSTYEREEGDIEGPFSVAVSIDDNSGGQIHWFTSDEFLNERYNAYSSGANMDMAINALSDLIGESEAMAIRSKSLNYNYLTISDSTSSLLKVLMIGVFPLTYLGVGICVILNRKKVQHETV